MLARDLYIESYTNHLPSGMRPVETNNAIKVIHIPTGIHAVCYAEKSQIKNRNIAMLMVEYGLAELGWKDD